MDPSRMGQQREFVSKLPQEECDQTHPGFTITCRCGSTRVIVEDMTGFSSTSGGRGSVDLRCQACGRYTEIKVMY